MIDPKDSANNFDYWYRHLPEDLEGRVWAILKRYEGKAPHGVADTVFEALCPNQPVLGKLEDMFEAKLITYAAGRFKEHTCPTLRYWRTR